jgi:hypothetical protein
VSVSIVSIQAVSAKGDGVMKRVIDAAMGVLMLAAGAAQADTSVKILDWNTKVPASWTQQRPETSMRLAQFQAAAAMGQDPATVVVFYFGAGGGGPVQANVERWESQFSSPDGKPVKALTRTAKVGAWPVTWVELSGTYSRGVGMGPQGQPKTDQTLVAAIVETPKGNLTFHLYGPKAAVAQQRKAFEAMVNGLK